MIENLSEKKLPENCFVFKHSTRCPISANAAAEVKGFTWAETLYWINVVEQRELSDWVRDTYGVEHQSPQLIRIVGGKPAAVLNHHKIREENFTSF